MQRFKPPIFDVLYYDVSFVPESAQLPELPRLGNKEGFKGVMLLSCCYQYAPVHGWNGFRYRNPSRPAFSYQIFFRLDLFHKIFIIALFAKALAATNPQLQRRVEIKRKKLRMEKYRKVEY